MSSATLQVLLTFRPYLPELVRLFNELLSADPDNVANQQAKDAKIAQLETQVQEALGMIAQKDATIAEQGAALSQFQSDDVVATEVVTEITSTLREILNRAYAVPPTGDPVIIEPPVEELPGFEPEPLEPVVEVESPVESSEGEVV